MQSISSINFNTSNQTLRQLLGNGLTYSVPRFQRDYSWTQEEWEDLWQDILSILPGGEEPIHYMGYLVMQTADNRTFEIIDGQQRLTTLSLLILAILNNIQTLIDRNIDVENNKRRLDQLRNSYIGFLDPVTLIPTPKLTLNRNNNAYYQNYLVPLERLPRRGLNSSEHLLRKAFEWFDGALRKHFAANSDGAEYARLIDIFSDKLFFTVITVTDELNAFKVFETLNARGVRLSSTDLLKNYLFSIVYRDGAHESEINALEQRWEKIVGQLGSATFPDFLRVYWNSRYSFVRHADLFKRMRNEIHTKGQSFQLLRELEEAAEIYAALSQPEDTFWNPVPDQRRHISELRIFNVRQPYPLLLAAHRTLSDAEFVKVLRACAIISFRYNSIGGLAPGEQERVYNAAAQGLSSGNLTSSQDVISALKSIYISDERFRNSFEEKVISTTSSRNRRLVRYILFRLESHLASVDYEFESIRYTIEHILPVNAEAHWEQFTDMDVEQFVYRLGNMTLLQAQHNRDLGNKSFDEKKELYAASEFKITKAIPEENDEWTIDRIAQRQRWMARQATAIWRIPQLAS